MHTHSTPLTSTPSIAFTWPTTLRVRRRARQFFLRLVRFVVRCADTYSATVQYDALSRLSDVELERRGFARGDVHRHVASTLTNRRN